MLTTEQSLYRAILVNPLDTLAIQAWLDFKEERGDKITTLRKGRRRLSDRCRDEEIIRIYRYGLLRGLRIPSLKTFLEQARSLFEKHPLISIHLDCRYPYYYHLPGHRVIVWGWDEYVPEGEKQTRSLPWVSQEGRPISRRTYDLSTSVTGEDQVSFLASNSLILTDIYQFIPEELRTGVSYAMARIGLSIGCVNYGRNLVGLPLLDNYADLTRFYEV